MFDVQYISGPSSKRHLHGCHSSVRACGASGLRCSHQQPFDDNGDADDDDDDDDAANDNEEEG